MRAKPSTPTRPFRWPWLAAVLAAGAGGPATVPAGAGNETGWEQLIVRSPFSAAGQTGAPAPESGAGLEFRGFYTMGQETFFRVDEPARNRGAWLVLGQTEDGIQVKHHDPVAETITVEFRGQTLILAWRAGKVVNAPADMPPPGVDLVPPRYIRNGLQNRSLLREELEPQHMDNEWFREFVRKYGPPVFRTEP